VNLQEKSMLKRMSSYTIVGMLALALAAGRASAQSPGEMEIRQGVIEQITLGIGSLIGGGTGRDVAMVLGTLGGALAGNEIQKRRDQPQQAQQIIVRVKSGVLVSVTQPVNANLRQGQRVYIEGSGEGARVIAQ